MTINVEQFIKDLKEMKVSELNQLVKAIETEFGVTAAIAAAPVQVVQEEETEKTVELVSAGTNKIGVIKLVRELLALGLLEAKNFAEAGGVIKEGLSPEEADKLAKQFTDLGAQIKIK